MNIPLIIVIHRDWNKGIPKEIKKIGMIHKTLSLTFVIILLFRYHFNLIKHLSLLLTATSTSEAILLSVKIPYHQQTSLVIASFKILNKQCNRIRLSKRFLKTHVANSSTLLQLTQACLLTILRSSIVTILSTATATTTSDIQ